MVVTFAVSGNGPGKRIIPGGCMRVYEGDRIDNGMETGEAVSMQFARLDGFVTKVANGRRWVTVVLDTGREVETVRDEAVPEAFEHEDAAWLADQLVQETLGNELALDGWEVVGEGVNDHEEHVMLDVLARSRTWVIRRVP